MREPGTCGMLCPCSSWPEEPDDRPALADQSLPDLGVE